MAWAALVIGFALGLAACLYLRRLARQQIDEIYPKLDQATLEAEALAQSALDDARARAAAQQAELIARRDTALRGADEAYAARIEAITERRDGRLAGPVVEYPQRLEEITARRDRDLELAEHTRARRDAELRQKEASGAQLEVRYARQSEQIEERYFKQWQALGDEWQAGLARIESLVERIWSSNCPTGGRNWLAELDELAAAPWQAAAGVPSAMRFGKFRVELSQIPHGVPLKSELAERGPASFTLPALVAFPDRASLVFEARGPARQKAIEVLQATMLRLLVSIPPGKLRFTIVDPVGLGENFAGFMHLADFNEALVTSRIWTEPRHIEARLADLSEHMENVIQKYLRNEFESIEAYNREAGEIAEPFRFLVVANFPANFTEAAQRRLLSIAASGPRCGVYLLLAADMQLPLATGVSLEELERHATTFVAREGQFHWRHAEFGHFPLEFDVPPPAAEVTPLVQAAGRYANEAGRVEVPFEIIAPPAEEMWTASAQAGIDVPLGRAGATRLQHLKLGHGTSQHVLVAGKTGSGKSTLLHALVTNIALRYSPDEIELYLIDFKQGVEFKTYATHALPHARVVAIESDREFGASALARLDAELKSRADRFRAAGVQDLAGFRQAEPEVPMPRILIVVDEFQEFFVEDDRVSQDAALLLDRLVRQGRAFGIHVLLGSQTLAGAYSLARSTIGQMAVRIALQCSEADAHLILSEDNSAARLLARAGEAIYNDSNGLVEGNHPFQVVWLGDERREQYLDAVHALAERSGYVARPQVVFEGNAPADPARNELLTVVLEHGRPERAPAAPLLWLGEAVAIKDPTAVLLRRQSGANLLVVGQNEGAALGMFATGLVSLAAQHPASDEGRASFYVFDGAQHASEESASLARLATLTSDTVRVVASRELPAAVGQLSAELARRQSAAETPFAPVYVFAYGLQRCATCGARKTTSASRGPAKQSLPIRRSSSQRSCATGPRLGFIRLPGATA